jgi:hypothetical protein
LLPVFYEMQDEMKVKVERRNAEREKIRIEEADSE